MIKLNVAKPLTSLLTINSDFKKLKTDTEFQVSNTKLINVEKKLNTKSFTLLQDPNIKNEIAPLALLSPFVWTQKHEWNKINGIEEESLNFSVLHNAHVFGGRIRRRNSKYHDYSQLMLNGKFELSKNSYGILDGSRTLPSDIVKEIDGSLYLEPESLNKPALLEGDYFFIGSIHRHFGHFLVEGLSRLWALDYIPKEIKDNMSFLVYEDSLPEFAIRLLGLAGIPLQKIVYAPKHAIVERLFVPDTSYKTHHWASSLMQSTYNKISQNIVSDEKSERMIYLSRKQTTDRPLYNEANIENIFSSFGFEIITPEKFTIEEQIKIIRESKTIAGPVGSQMYLAAFSKASTLIVLAPNNFYLPDDLLLSDIRGSDIIVTLGSGIDYEESKEKRKWCISESQVKNVLENLVS